MRSGENTPAWYLVDSGRRIISGPFTERAATGATERYRDVETLPRGVDELRAAYGVWADDGTVELRATPADRAWEAHLSAQLDRLPSSSLQEGHPLRALLDEVASALVEAGFDLHDCAGDTAVGGVCLTPEMDSLGVVVRWRPHERVSADHVQPPAAEETVRRTMDEALGTVLTALGFRVGTAASGEPVVTWDDAYRGSVGR